MKSMYKPLLLVLSFALVACGGSEEAEESHNSETNTEESTDTVEVGLEPTDLPIDINLVMTEELPEDLDFKGNLIDAYTWQDRNGTNYFLRTITEEYDGSEAYLRSRNLYAYHYAVSPNGGLMLMRDVQDFVEDCEFDLNMSHELDAITLTDIDEDELGEVAFIYRLTCTSDVSPSTQKLIMLENGDKYPLRGNTQVMGMGGEFEAGDEFKNAPEGFQAHAEKLWSEHLTEYDFEL